MIRAFVALLLDEEIRAAVAAEIDRMRSLSQAVAWVPPPNLHVTVKFLGQQSDERLAEVADALAEASAATAPFTMMLRGVGAFPGMHQPRILWVGVAAGGVEARALHSRVEAALEGRHFPRDERPWHPHLTIGRVFDPRRWRRDTSPALHQAIARAASAELGSLTVSRIALMRSDLSPAGARYRELRALELGAQ
jgi:RNA 2',3'-cyclic 3'-phosphodiesterase